MFFGDPQSSFLYIVYVKFKTFARVSQRSPLIPVKQPGSVQLSSIYVQKFGYKAPPALKWLHNVNDIIKQDVDVWLGMF